MSLDVGLIDDLHGQSVATVGFKQFGKVLSGFEPVFIERNINGIIEANLSDIVIAARARARFRSGFMREQTDYVMGNMLGVAYSAAPYAYQQEKGFTTPTGGRVSANNFFIPSAYTGMRQYVLDLQLFLSTLLKGAAYTARAVKSITRGAVTLTTSPGKSSGVHKFTRKIAVGGGKFRYQYTSKGQGVSRFTRVLKPGFAKGFGQVGRKRRVV